jgi:drug/metabolite transporter (DMT)-like permease
MTNTSTRSSDHSVPDQQVLGIVLILASNVIMALGDALIKYVSADLTIWQIFVVRSIFALCYLGAYAYWNRGPVVPRHYGWVLLRSLFLVLTWLSFYASLPVLNLSLAAVVIYTNVIFTTLLSAVLLKERVSVKQWLGVLSGFVGVAIILRPGTDSFSWFVLMPLAGALCYSLASLVTRHKCQGGTRPHPRRISACLFHLHWGAGHGSDCRDWCHGHGYRLFLLSVWQLDTPDA